VLPTGCQPCSHQQPMEATARPKPVTQIGNLLYRRLVVGQAFVQPSASGAASASRIANPRYSRLPACATAAQQTPVASMAAQTSWERGASLRTKVRRPAGGAMLRAPSLAQIVPSVAQIGNLLSHRLVVGQAFVQPSASGDAGAPRIANPRYGRLPACATAAQQTAVAGMAAQTSWERGASLRTKVRGPTGGAMLRAPSVAQIVPSVAQIGNLLDRRLVVGQAFVQPSASGDAGAPRIANPRYGRLPACATAAQQTPVASIAAQTSWERGASLRTKVRRPTGGAMLRAPSLAQIVPSVAQIGNLLYRRLVVGQASVQPSASPPAGASRIANPRYSRLPACATAAQQTPVASMAAQTSWERGASLRTKVRRPAGGAMLRAPSVAQIVPSVAQAAAWWPGPADRFRPAQRGLSPRHTHHSVGRVVAAFRGGWDNSLTAGRLVRSFGACSIRR
jgi:hypothetical protein